MSCLPQRPYNNTTQRDLQEEQKYLHMKPAPNKENLEGQLYTFIKTRA